MVKIILTRPQNPESKLSKNKNTKNTPAHLSFYMPFSADNFFCDSYNTVDIGQILELGQTTFYSLFLRGDNENGKICSLLYWSSVTVQADDYTTGPHVK